MLLFVFDIYILRKLDNKYDTRSIIFYGKYDVHVRTINILYFKIENLWIQS